MTPLRWFYAAFWIFIGGMLLWQFTSYNKAMTKAVAAAPPPQSHFYFDNSPGTTTNLDTPKPDGADVRQVNFTADRPSPDTGNFVCHVTLKNEGNRKAVNVQVVVSPYRGILMNDPDQSGGRADPHALNDNSSAAQTSQWVSFPDLAPGESSTQDVTFFAQQGYSPGDNPNPEINFHSEQPKPAPPSPPSP